MIASLFPDLAPPPSPSISRAEYLRDCQAAILQIALTGHEVDADDVHHLWPCPNRKWRIGDERAARRRLAVLEGQCE